MRTLALLFLCFLSHPKFMEAGKCLTQEADTLKRLPKAELHLHLGGAYPLAYLLSIATPNQAEELNATLASIQEKTSYHDIFACFRIVGEIVNTEEKVTQGVAALCRELQEDSVEYAEIRTGLKALSSNYEEYLKAILTGIEAQSSPQFRASVLLSLRRNSSVELAKATVDLALKYRDQGVIGIDLSGDSSIGESSLILPELIRAKQEGLTLVVHMGESPKETDQLALLHSLQPDRIGHGVFLCPDAEAWILDHQIPIEVCLTSGTLVGFIDHPSNHPGLRYFSQGHPIVFCTDDPLLFSTSLTQELLIAHTQAGLSLDAIEQIVEDSFSYAACYEPHHH